MTRLPLSRLLTPLALAGLLAGCGGELDDNRYPTGSRSIVASADYQVLHAVDTDGGRIASHDLQSGTTQLVEVGDRPVRIARSGDRILATLRGERAIAVLEEGPSGLELTDTITTGAEPYGIVASESGDRVYVASSLQGEVSELDGESLATLRTWSVADEPRWLALHPSGKALYVGSAMNGTLTFIDLDDDAVERVELPSATGMHQQTGDSIELTSRITGDLAVSPNGRTLAVPVLYVDNISPVPPATVDATGNSLVDPEDNEDFVEMGGGAGGYGGGPKRFNPGVVTFTSNPSGILQVDDIQVVGLNGVSLDPEFDFGAVSSYAGSLSFTPSGDGILATLEGSSAVLALPVAPTTDGSGSVGAPTPVGASTDEVMDDGFGFGGASLEFRETSTVITGAGPSATAWTSDTEVWVHSRFDRGLAELGLARVGGALGVTAGLANLGNSAPAHRAIELAPASLPADIAAGRDLFYASDDSRMAAGGSAVSCATCHFDGRTDGLTWPFEGSHELQTPSLAGVVSMTAPVTWTDDVESVEDEVIITSQGRMGGLGLEQAEAELVAAFVDWTPEPDVPLAGSDSEAIARGQLIFEREDVGCAGCHSGAAYTDNEAYEMLGLESVRTRGLVGIAASAPYFHDGSAPSMRAVLERVRDGSMGDTSMLDGQQLADLETFVLSL